jgi:uncharacterized Zn finger protein (UPF0148 family)
MSDVWHVPADDGSGEVEIRPTWFEHKCTVCGKSVMRLSATGDFQCESHPTSMTGKSAEQQARDLLEQCGVEDAQSFTAGDVVALANFIAETSRCRRQLAAIRALSDTSTEFDGRGRIYVYAEDLDKILDGSVAAGLGKP